MKEIEEIIKKLKKFYPEAKCSLDFETPFQMCIAVMLSAQCTDARVNKTTPLLFKEYGTVSKINEMDIKALEKIIYPCGFYKTKAKNIKEMAKQIIEKYNGIVPKNINDLLTLPGIGRKSANVIMLEAFNNPQGIAIDTHAKRISKRIGLSKENEPEKIEQDLLKIIPKEYYKDINHLLVYHGRKICQSRNPKCETCPIEKKCQKNI